MKIIPRDIPPRSVHALEQAGVHPLLARLYAARGVTGTEELDDSLAKLLPPDGLLGIASARPNACAWSPITTATAPPPVRWPCAACVCWARNR